jgi:mono/diheme cytochrome c family protein
MEPANNHRHPTRRCALPLVKFYLRLSGAMLAFTALKGRAADNPPVFTGVVEPIMARTCVSCHGEKKQKKNLRLDSLAAIMKGGKDGAVVVPGKADDSDLVQRLHLDLTDDDHMPPKSKTQLNDKEILVLEWWINSGAPGDVPLNSLQVPDAVKTAIHDLGSASKPAGAK